MNRGLLPRSRRCLPAVAAAAALLLLAGAPAGCDTIAQDVDLLAGALMPPSPTEAAMMMFDTHDADRRRQGTVLLAAAPFGGEAEYVGAYRDLAQNDPDPTARAAALRALARHGTPEDATILAAQLAHPNEHVRWEAAMGLQRLHNPAAVRDLLDVLRDDEERLEVRLAAAHALGQYPQDRVFHALLGALDARELSLNRTAEQSLATLTGRELGLDARRWLRWYNRADPGEAFAGQREYRYRTYQRDPTLLERMAFWGGRTFEEPGLPEGLREHAGRRTYDR